MSISARFILFIVLAFHISTFAQEKASAIKKLSQDADVILTGKVVENYRLVILWRAGVRTDARRPYGHGNDTNEVGILNVNPS